MFHAVNNVSEIRINPSWSSKKWPGVASAYPIELESPWCQITNPENAAATNRQAERRNLLSFFI